MTHKEWLKTIFKSYVKKHKPEEAEQEHIKDFLDKNPEFKVSTRVSYLALKEKSEAWTRRLNKKNKNIKESGQVELICEFEDGSKYVRLADQVAKNWEGKHMGHCVASYTSHQGIFSLRDEDNIPHATIEVTSGLINQIKGKGNSKVAFRYHQQVLQGIEKSGVRLSRKDIENIGYKAMTPTTVAQIKSQFSDHCWMELEGFTYFNTHSKLKLLQPLTSFSLEIFTLIVDHRVDCLPAFKQLLRFFKEVNGNLKSYLSKLSDQGRVLYVRAILDYARDNKIEISIDTMVVARAIQSGDSETLFVVLSEFNSKQEAKIKHTPHAAYLSFEHLIDWKACVEAAISVERLDMLMMLLKSGARISQADMAMSRLIALAVKLNHAEIFKVTLAAKDKISPATYIQYALPLFKENKHALLDAVLDTFAVDKPEVIKSLVNSWYKECNNDFGFLDYLIARNGFKEEYYHEAFSAIILTEDKNLTDEFFKRGADIKFKNGQALYLALSNNRMALAHTLLKEGFLDLGPHLDRLCEPALKFIARDLLQENNTEVLNKFLTAMTTYKFTSVVKVLNAGGVMTPDQRQKAIDEAAGFHDPDQAKPYKFVDSVKWEQDLDEYARTHKIYSLEWAKLPLMDKLRRWSSHKEEAARVAKLEEETKVRRREEQEVIFRIDPRTGRRSIQRRGGIFQNMYGNYQDDEGNVYRTIAEADHASDRIRMHNEERRRRALRRGDADIARDIFNHAGEIMRRIIDDDDDELLGE